VGRWKDGRIGTFRGLREGKHIYGGTAFTNEGAFPAGPYKGYEMIVAEIARFFRTGAPPIAPEETIEIYAFMEAADRSKELGGQPVSIAGLMQEAEKEAARIGEK
jgi:hypothetical protein